MLVDRAVDARPLTPPPPPPEPEVIVEVSDADLEAPDESPRDMARQVAAIMSAYPDLPPLAIADRYCASRSTLMSATQRRAVTLAVEFGSWLVSDLVGDLFSDLPGSFGQLHELTMNDNRAFVMFLFEQLSAWAQRPVRRSC